MKYISIFHRKKKYPLDILEEHDMGKTTMVKGTVNNTSNEAYNRYTVI